MRPTSPPTQSSWNPKPPHAPARRRLRGFAAGITALVAASAATLLGIAGNEIHARRVFEHASLGAASAEARVEHVGRLDAPVGIALIGDSWVSKSKLDAPLALALDEVGLGELSVRGIGEGGATSRRILQNLLSKEDSDVASGVLLEDPRYRYCVVVAGVNDSGQHLGPDFYSHHVIEIARMLLSSGVTPILVELPEYGIETVRARRTGLRLVKDVVLSELFDDGEIDVIGKYRDALRAALSAEGLLDAVELVSFDAVATDYHAATALYQDPAHLNEMGRALFAAHLADAIRGRLERDGVEAFPHQGQTRLAAR